MTDGEDRRRKHGDQAGPASPHLSRKLLQARLALAWEGFWAALWPLPVVLGLFLAFALFDLPQLIGGWWHAGVLFLFVAAASACAVSTLRRFRWPREREIQRRLERDSGLSHRPLAALTDTPALGGADGAALWAVHQRRLAAALRRLRVRPPRSPLPGIDRWAARAAILLVVVAGLGVAGDRAPERIARAVVPVLQAAPAVPGTIDVWMQPPDYTGRPPVYVRTDQPRLSIPAGTRLFARVGGGEEPPLLRIDAEDHTFDTAGPSSFAAERTISAGETISIVQDGDVLAHWAVDVIADMPPTATLTRAPSITQRQALRIDYGAKDDYGLAGLGAQLRLVDDGAEGEPGAVLELPIPSPGLRAREAAGSVYQDLTAHAWAGRDVEVRVVAVDGAGQRGESEAARVTLPERQFNHPVARLIIETRKRLADERGARSDVARRLDAISRMGEMFADDTVVHLSLSAAKWRLRRDQEANAIDAVRDLLWDTALRLEDGNLTLAERELRDAQQALMDALRRDASQEEIDRAIQRLWSAIQKFLDSMMAQAADQPPLTPEQIQQMQSLEAQDLREMLQRMRDLAQSGSKDAAMQMLAQLQNMLENLRAAQAMGQDGQAAQQMMQMMRELQEMARQQRGLLDQTFRDSQGGEGQRMPGGQMPGQQPGQPPGQQPGQGMQPGTGEGLSGQQERLRRMLGDLMRRLGEQSGDIPNALGRAERAMRDAVGSLEGGQPGEAVGPQSEALDQLQQAGRSMLEDMARQMGFGEPDGQQAGETNPQFDPLGRPPGGRGLDSRDVVIPTESDMQRARDIRDELYRRSGDRARPIFERDYIDRLLERF